MKRKLDKVFDAAKPKQKIYLAKKCKKEKASVWKFLYSLFF